MRNTLLWTAAILAGVFLTIQTDGDLRARFYGYRNSVNAELRGYRDMEREFRKTAREMVQARAAARHEAERLRAEISQGQTREFRNRLRDELRGAIRQAW